MADPLEIALDELHTSDEVRHELLAERATLTARVEAQAARIEELEGALRGFMAATSDEAGWGKVDYMEGFGVYERIALCRNHASRALHGGDDDGE